MSEKNNAKHDHNCGQTSTCHRHILWIEHWNSGCNAFSTFNSFLLNENQEMWKIVFSDALINIVHCYCFSFYHCRILKEWNRYNVKTLNVLLRFQTSSSATKLITGIVFLNFYWLDEPKSTKRDKTGKWQRYYIPNLAINFLLYFIHFHFLAERKFRYWQQFSI